MHDTLSFLYLSLCVINKTTKNYLLKYTYNGSLNSEFQFDVFGFGFDFFVGVTFITPCHIEDSRQTERINGTTYPIDLQANQSCCLQFHLISVAQQKANRQHGRCCVFCNFSKCIESI